MRRAQVQGRPQEAGEKGVEEGCVCPQVQGEKGVWKGQEGREGKEV